MKIVGFIPAKGSSTRTPAKNMQKVLGVPLFLWAANNLNKVLDKQDIYIDSDSEEILAIAKKHGFNTIKRPIELATNATDGNQLLQWQAKNVDADIYIQHLPPMIFLTLFWLFYTTPPIILHYLHCYILKYYFLRH